MAVTIEQDAPVITRASIRIDATPEVVWDTVTDIEAWPKWNPAIKRARLQGPLAEGTTFTWKAGPGTIRSTLLEVDAPRLIAWKGRTMGIDAVHVYRIDPADGGVELTTEESWSGILPRLLRSMMQKTLDGSIRGGLESAKARAESYGT